MKNRKRKIILFVLTTLSAVLILSGCQNIKLKFKGFEESFKGLNMIVRTYDEESQMMDEIKGKSIMIKRDKTFDSNEDTADSPVIKIEVGRNEIHHVGSSMIIQEEKLTNVFDDYTKEVDIQNHQRGIPMLNELVNQFKNSFTGKKKVILIRSQNGTPLATYAGDKVSIYQTEVPKSTGLLIDGHYLFIYRCDYTIYDADLLLK
ncbi:DUF5052 family protein [Vagococcus lutrae]|uniref:DUF5052 family protein n=1 Tax=Vagococcus lutrae TaxID=81947 RepID=UPI0023A9A7F9|nr:DUF5052 family protein [Vagococcus lutrae]WEB82243.1 DUF5052 family protein [Vagococcus lutrae]